MKFRDEQVVQHAKCKHPYPPEFDVPPTATGLVYTDVPRPIIYMETDPYTGERRPGRNSLPRFTYGTVLPIWKADQSMYHLNSTKPYH